MLTFVEITILDIALLFVWRYLHDLCRRKRMKEHFSSLGDSDRASLRENFDLIDLFVVAAITVSCVITLIVAGCKGNGSFIIALFEWARILYTYIVPFFLIRMLFYLYGKYIYAYYFVYSTYFIKIRYEYNEDENVTYFSRYKGISPRSAYYKYFITDSHGVGVVYGDPNHLASLFGDAYEGKDDAYFELRVNRKTKTLISRYLSLENISCYVQSKE